MRRTLLLAALLALAACSGEAPPADATTQADTLTRRQRDSIIAEMPLPGAGVVGAALEPADAAEARARAHDTIR
jgi:ABC-type glycerol-3-phosphate transport system substrate-binding protein